MFGIYNKKQATFIRTSTFLVIFILSLFASYRFYYNSFYATTPMEKMPESWKWIHREGKSAKEPWAVFPSATSNIPKVVEIPLSPRFAIAFGMVALFTILGAYFCFRHQRTSDFLIDTESEIRKVSWPTIREVGSSSTVVIIVIIILGIYLFLVDISLMKALKWMFFEKV